MPNANRIVTRIQDQDDFLGTPASGVISYNSGSGKFATTSSLLGLSTLSTTGNITVNKVNIGSYSADVDSNLFLNSNFNPSISYMYGNTIIGKFSGPYMDGSINNTFVGSNIAKTSKLFYGGSNTIVGSDSFVNAGGILTSVNTLVGGSGYVNGTYTNVTLTLLSGQALSTYPIATIVVSGGAVTSVTITTEGVGADSTTYLTAPNSSLGGSGSGFSCRAVLTHANFNVVVGDNSLASVYSFYGSNNIIVGSQSAVGAKSSNRLILIGNTLEAPSSSTSNYISIANLIFGSGAQGVGTTPGTGKIGIKTASPQYDLDVAGQFGVSGGIITTDRPLINGTQTWNNTGVLFTAARINVTDTNSNANSLLIDAQVGGVSKFNVDKNGYITTPIQSQNSDTTNLTSKFSVRNFFFNNGTNGWSCPMGISNASAGTIGGFLSNTNFAIAANSSYSWTSVNQGTSQANVSSDLFLFRDASGVLAQRNGTSAQSWRLYNSYTDTNNFERFGINWSGNVCTIGTEASGTGAVRDLKIAFGSNAILRWDAPSVAMVLRNATDTANVNLALASVLAGGQVNFGYANSNTVEIGSNSWRGPLRSVNFISTAGICWQGTSTLNTFNNPPDLGIVRNATGVLKLTDGASGYGGLICGSPTGNVVGATIGAISGQTSHMLDLLNYSGTPVSYFDSNAGLRIGTTATNQRVIFQNGTNAQAAEAIFTIKNTAGQNIFYVDATRPEVAVGATLYFGQGNASASSFSVDSQGGQGWTSNCSTIPDINGLFGLVCSNNITKTGGTTSDVGAYWCGVTFAPTSGAANFNGYYCKNTINQTALASGVARGLYIADTLTSVSGTYRAIETNYGNVLINTGSGSYNGLTIKGAPNQTGQYIRILDASGTQLAAFPSGGGLIVGPQTTLGSTYGADIRATATQNQGGRATLFTSDETPGTVIGNGGGIAFGCKNDGTNHAAVAYIYSYKETADTNQNNALVFATRRTDGSVQERCRITGSGGAFVIGATGANLRNFRTFGSALIDGISSTPSSGGTIVPIFTVVSNGHNYTNYPGAVEYPAVQFDLSPTTTFNTGTIALQRAFRIQNPTYAATVGTTITSAATVQIDGAPIQGTNATLTESTALRVLTGQASGKAVVIQAASGQTQNVFEVQNVSGIKELYIDASGNLGFSNMPNSAPDFIAVPDAAISTYSGLTMRPASGNAAATLGLWGKGTFGSNGVRSQIVLGNTDIVADSVNTEFFSMRAVGSAFTFATGKNFGGAGVVRPFFFSAGYATDGVTNANQLYLNPNGRVGVYATAPSGQMHIIGQTGTIPALVVQGASGQSTNIFEVQDTNSSAKLYVTNNGYTYAPGGFYPRFVVQTDGSASAALFGLTSTSVANVYPAIIAKKVTAGGTENVQEWQNYTGGILGSMNGSGLFTAVSKSFDIPHPSKPNMRLRYGSLEGPENGVYVRGISEGPEREGGTGLYFSTIDLPDYWPDLVHEDSITVQTTPIGRFQPLFVDSFSSRTVLLKSEMPIKCFYTINGERKDIDRLIVEREA